MEIEKLIKHMREEAQDYRSGRTLGRAFADAEDVLDEAATALEQLQAENDRLRRERGAAVESIPHECKTCLYYTVTFNGCTPDYDCTNLDGGCSNNYDRWVWRGPKED